MKEELYINGESVDIFEDTTIVLNFKSNLLGDISKIVSSNSQTIRLPKTSRNNRILDNATMPSYSSAFRYRLHPARYLRNGVEVISKAFAVILDSSENYEVALTWGVMANFQEWVNGGGKLRDLDISLNMMWIYGRAAYPPSASFFQADYDCGVVLDAAASAQMTLHPSVKVSYLLERIQAFAGVTFDIPAPILQRFNLLAIPLITRVSGMVTRGYYLIRSGSGTADQQIQVIGLTMAVEPSPSAFYSVQESIVRILGLAQYPATTTTIKPIASGVMNIYVPGGEWALYFLPYGFEKEDRHKPCVLRFVEIREGEQYARTLQTWNITAVYAGTIRIDGRDCPLYRYASQGEQTFTFDALSDHEYGFVMSTGGQMRPANVIETGGWISLGGSFIPPQDTVDIEPSEQFYLRPNLPDITQVDFIKALCVMFGLFAVGDLADTNKLRFVTLDMLMSNKANAYDWSDKLIDSNRGEPATTSFKIRDYCRNNYFKYKDDDTVEIDATGNLTVFDESLDREKTVVTLPFAASDGNRIPHYAWNDDKTVVEQVSVEDRIMNIVNNGTGGSALSFTGLEFRTLLDQYYPLLSSMLNNAITIKDSFRLTEIDLKSLDFTIPVYLKQYGRYFGIDTIQSRGDVCEATLILLPMD